MNKKVWLVILALMVLAVSAITVAEELKQVNVLSMPSPYYNVGRQRNIDTILVHETDGNYRTLAEAYNAFASQELSTHYFISRSGQVVQYVNDGDTAWHAGMSAHGGESSLNHNTIGIEIENKVGEQEITQAQKDALLALTANLQRKYDIPNRNIVAHSAVSTIGKQDGVEPVQFLQSNINSYKNSVGSSPITVTTTSYGRLAENTNIKTAENAMSQGNYQTAIASLQSMLSGSLSKEDKILVQGRLVSAYESAGDYDQAAYYQRERISLLRSTVDNGEQPDELMHLADIQFKSGDTTGALNTALQAKQRYNTIATAYVDSLAQTAAGVTRETVVEPRLNEIDLVTKAYASGLDRWTIAVLVDGIREGDIANANIFNERVGLIKTVQQSSISDSGTTNALVVSIVSGQTDKAKVDAAITMASQNDATLTGTSTNYFSLVNHDHDQDGARDGYAYIIIDNSVSDFYVSNAPETRNGQTVFPIKQDEEAGILNWFGTDNTIGYAYPDGHIELTRDQKARSETESRLGKVTIPTTTVQSFYTALGSKSDARHEVDLDHLNQGIISDKSIAQNRELPSFITARNDLNGDAVLTYHFGENTGATLSTIVNNVFPLADTYADLYTVTVNVNGQQRRAYPATDGAYYWENAFDELGNVKYPDQKVVLTKDTEITVRQLDSRERALGTLASALNHGIMPSAATVSAEGTSSGFSWVSNAEAGQKVAGSGELTVKVEAGKVTATDSSGVKTPVASVAVAPGQKISFVDELGLLQAITAGTDTSITQSGTFIVIKQSGKPDITAQSGLTIAPVAKPVAQGTAVASPSPTTTAPTTTTTAPSTTTTAPATTTTAPATASPVQGPPSPPAMPDITLTPETSWVPGSDKLVFEGDYGTKEPSVRLEISDDAFGHNSVFIDGVKVGVFDNGAGTFISLSDENSRRIFSYRPELLNLLNNMYLPDASLAERISLGTAVKPTLLSDLHPVGTPLTTPLPTTASTTTAPATTTTAPSTTAPAATTTTTPTSTPATTASPTTTPTTTPTSTATSPTSTATVTPTTTPTAELRVLPSFDTSYKNTGADPVRVRFIDGTEVLVPPNVEYDRTYNTFKNTGTKDVYITPTSGIGPLAPRLVKPGETYLAQTDMIQKVGPVLPVKYDELKDRVPATTTPAGSAQGAGEKATVTPTTYPNIDTELQQSLMSIGYSGIGTAGKPDNKLGPKTAAAIIDVARLRNIAGLKDLDPTTAEGRAKIADWLKEGTNKQTFTEQLKDLEFADGALRVKSAAPATTTSPTVSPTVPATTTAAAQPQAGLTLPTDIRMVQIGDVEVPVGRDAQGRSVTPVIDGVSRAYTANINPLIAAQLINVNNARAGTFYLTHEAQSEKSIITYDISGFTAADPDRVEYQQDGVGGNTILARSGILLHTSETPQTAANNIYSLEVRDSNLRQLFRNSLGYVKQGTEPGRTQDVLYSRDGTAIGTIQMSNDGTVKISNTEERMFIEAYADGRYATGDLDKNGKIMSRVVEFPPDESGNPQGFSRDHYDKNRQLTYTDYEVIQDRKRVMYRKVEGTIVGGPHQQDYFYTLNPDGKLLRYNQNDFNEFGQLKSSATGRIVERPDGTISKEQFDEAKLVLRAFNTMVRAQAQGFGTAKIGPLLDTMMQGATAGKLVSDTLQWVGWDEFRGWRAGVDRIFSGWFGGIDGWTSKLCDRWIDKMPANVGLGTTGFPSAFIMGEMSEVREDTPGTKIYFYMINAVVDSSNIIRLDSGDQKLKFKLIVYLGENAYDIVVNKQCQPVKADEIELSSGESFQCQGDTSIIREKEAVFTKVCIKFLNTDVIDGRFSSFLDKEDQLCNTFKHTADNYNVRAPFGLGDYRRETGAAAVDQQQQQQPTIPVVATSTGGGW